MKQDIDQLLNYAQNDAFDNGIDYNPNDAAVMKVFVQGLDGVFDDIDVYQNRRYSLHVNDEGCFVFSIYRTNTDKIMCWTLRDGVLRNTSHYNAPTIMPEWLQKQFDSADKTVQTWSEGKRKAAGIV